MVYRAGYVNAYHHVGTLWTPPLSMYFSGTICILAVLQYNSSRIYSLDFRRPISLRRILFLGQLSYPMPADEIQMRLLLTSDNGKLLITPHISNRSDAWIRNTYFLANFVLFSNMQISNVSRSRRAKKILMPHIEIAKHR